MLPGKSLSIPDARVMLITQQRIPVPDSQDRDCVKIAGVALGVCTTSKTSSGCAYGEIMEDHTARGSGLAHIHYIVIWRYIWSF